MAQDVAYDGAVNGGMLRCREEEDGIDARHLPIHLSNGTFELEIGGGSQTADDVGAAELAREIDGKPVVSLDGDARLVGEDRLDETDALARIEEAMLIGIYAYGNDDMVEDLETSVDDAFMTDSKGVERAREYRFFYDCHQ